MLNFCFLIPIRHIVAWNHVEEFRVKIGSGASAVGRWKNPKRRRVNTFDAQFRACGEKKPLREIVTRLRM